MKRVLHVIDSLHLGGAQEVVLNLATCGDRSRFHHEVATLHGRGVYWRRLSEKLIPLHSLSPHKFFPWYLVSLPALLRSGTFDILHCHLVAANILAKPIGRACGIPVLLNHDHTNDDYRATQRVRLALDRLSNQCASHIIAVSESCREFLIERENVPPDKISLIQNAIDLERFSADGAGSKREARTALGLPEDVPIVAGVGRLNPQKNFALFLQVAASLLTTHPRTQFVIAGEGPQEAALKRLVADLGLGGRVHFTGYLRDTRRIYEACDILLMPSLFEGLPMTLLEAMAMRVPVVASRLDGIAEVVEEGRDGFLVRSGDAEGFAECLGRLLDDPALAQAIGGAACEKVTRSFSAARLCSEVEAVYDRFSK